MKASKLLSIVLLSTSFAWAGAPSAQQSSTQTGTPPSTPTPPATRRAQHRAQMQSMCKEHMEAMQADVQKMQSAFDKMKTNVASISNADEKTRWQANLDMWQTVLDHHQMMLKHMQDVQASGMGCGMMGMGGMMGPAGMGPMNPGPATPPPPK